MQLRLLHTADWHLGHSLHELSRSWEHDRFLDWLLDTLQAEAIDVLVIAGDIFDAANPSAFAQAQWYGFCSRARIRMANLDIIAIAGNHDSASRIEAPKPLLDELGIRVLGGLERKSNGDIDYERIIVPVTDASGRQAGHCAAVPFLRPGDLPRCPEAEDELIAGVQTLYAQVLDELAARTGPGEVRIALGHCHMTNSEISDMSERRILGGYEHALPLDIFGPRGSGADYIALGHLHKAQRVGGLEHVRYSGSPIPLSMTEADYRHQVCIAEFSDGQLSQVQCPSIPRALDIIRLPRKGPAAWPEVEAQLAELPELDPDASHEPAPFLEVRVRLEQVDSALRRKVQSAIANKRVRLVKLSIEYSGDGQSLVEREPLRNLADVEVDDVFRALHQRHHDAEPSDELWQCFHTICRQVEESEAS